MTKCISDLKDLVTPNSFCMQKEKKKFKPSPDIDK